MSAHLSVIISIFIIVILIGDDFRDLEEKLKIAITMASTGFGIE